MPHDTLCTFSQLIIVSEEEDGFWSRRYFGTTDRPKNIPKSSRYNVERCASALPLGLRLFQINLAMTSDVIIQGVQSGVRHTARIEAGKFSRRSVCRKDGWLSAFSFTARGNWLKTSQKERTSLRLKPQAQPQTDWGGHKWKASESGSFRSFRP